MKRIDIPIEYDSENIGCTRCGKEIPKELKIALNQLGKPNLTIAKLSEWIFTHECKDRENG